MNHRAIRTSLRIERLSYLFWRTSSRPATSGSISLPIRGLQTSWISFSAVRCHGGRFPTGDQLETLSRWLQRDRTDLTCYFNGPDRTVRVLQDLSEVLRLAYA